MAAEVEGEFEHAVHESRVHRFGKVEGKPFNYSHMGALIGYLREEGYLPTREVRKISFTIQPSSAGGKRMRIESPALLLPKVQRRIRHLDVEHRGEHYHFTHSF